MSDDCRPARVVPVQGPDRLFGVLHPLLPLLPTPDAERSRLEATEFALHFLLRPPATSGYRGLSFGWCSEQVDHWAEWRHIPPR
jgi:hypothetical protein